MLLLVFPACQEHTLQQPTKQNAFNVQMELYLPLKVKDRNLVSFNALPEITCPPSTTFASHVLPEHLPTHPVPSHATTVPMAPTVSKQLPPVKLVPTTPTPTNTPAMPTIVVFVLRV